MQKPTFIALITLFFCGKVLAEGTQIVAEASSVAKTNSVPESSVAILLGAVLWFFLLRKRA